MKTRINGAKFNFDTLPDSDVLNIMDHTANRWQTAQDELSFLTQVAVDRGLFPNVVIGSFEQAVEEFGPASA